MLALVIPERPKSHNAKKKAGYTSRIQSVFRCLYPGYIPAQTQMYARVYYFTSSLPTQDADNISKPIVDALKGLAYEDDRLVVLRIAAIQRIAAPEDLDLTDMPDSAIEPFVAALVHSGDAIYVEIGLFRPEFLTFGDV